MHKEFRLMDEAELLIKFKEDLRDRIFQKVERKEVIASIKAKGRGIISGVNEASKVAEKIGLKVISCIQDGTKVENGDIIATVKGAPKQIAIAEDLLVGLIAKPSGIATAARKAVELSKGKATIVSGAWKKMPFQIKEIIRSALVVGGVELRICKDPFVYLDKNYVRIFGNIGKALESVGELKDKVKVVQIKGDTDPIEIEAVKAAKNGANIIFVDTGELTDLEKVVKILKENGLREGVKLAFGGSIKMEDIPKICENDVDILDIGRAIIDAPMLDVSFDVHYFK
jgi:nicotinate-nucleotide pyrophosphorylase (carboxylating)